MNIRNLTVTGPADGFQLCVNSGNLLYGIWFNDASGTVNNVTVDHIYQKQNGAFASCGTGRAIRADGLTGARTVTITKTTARDYQKTAFQGFGSTMTLRVTGSTAGPPHPLEGLIAQNGVTFQDVTSGTAANNTIHGSSQQAPPPGCGNCGPSNGTSVLLFNADNVRVSENELVGRGTDIGISVSQGSTRNTIRFNNVTRTASGNPANIDGTGIGINVAAGDNSARLICNTFSGWKPNRNIVGAIQVACTPLPDGAECDPYSAQAPEVIGVARSLTWQLTRRTSLPPGLSLAPDGAITGTPPKNSAGAYDFRLRVTTGRGLTAASDQAITIAPGCTTPTATPSPTAPPTGAPSAGPGGGDQPTTAPSAGPGGGNQPGAAPTAGPGGGNQPGAAPTAVASGLPVAEPGRPLTTLALGMMTLAAAAVSATVIGMRRRGARQH